MGHPQTSPGMTLSERKKLLVAESALLRLEISHALDTIEESVGWVEHGVRAGRAVQKGLPLMGILGSAFLAWKTLRKKPAAPVAEAAAGEEASGLSLWITRGIQAANLIGPVLAMIRTKPSA